MNHYVYLGRRQVLLFLFTIIYFSPVFAQTSLPPTKEHKNAVSLEMMGHGFAYTFSYERQLLNNNFFRTTAQIGVGYYGQQSDAVPLWIPITVNQLTAVRPGEFIEMGVGKIMRSQGRIFNDARGIGGLKV